MASALPSTSAACLLHPFSEAMLASFLLVLRDIPSSLAEPFVSYELRRHRLDFEARDVRNVLFKLHGAGLSHNVVPTVGPGLKSLQKNCPDCPTVLVRAERDRCVKCSASLTDGKRHESFDQQMPGAMRYSPATSSTRFRAFTRNAGLQHAVFQPKQCPSPACGWHYIAGWMYKVDRNRIVNCTWLGPHPSDYFVIPKMRSWLAVDMDLLSLVSDSFLHQKASFRSVCWVLTSFGAIWRSQCCDLRSV